MASRAALNELGEEPLVPLHSSKNLTQGVGLSLVLGLWDLPELWLFIPVKGGAQMKMAQSGIRADRELADGILACWVISGKLRNKQQNCPGLRSLCANLP